MDGGSEKEHPGFVKNLRTYCIEYTENTSLHGVKYIGERRRNIAERVCWLLIVGISVYVCSVLMIKTYDKWQTSPVIVSFAEKPRPIWSIPFPAVTICPQTKSRQSVYNFTDYYTKLLFAVKNLTDDEMKQFQDVQLVCNFDEVGRDRGGFPYDHVVDNETIAFLYRIAPRLDQSMLNCEWSKYFVHCVDYFTPILTDEGVCYTFNMLNKDDIYRNTAYIDDNFLDRDHDNNGWTLEDGYGKGSDQYFPKRARSAGSEEGLTFVLSINKSDLDYMCKGPVQGFKMLLHQPGEIPRVSSQYIHLPADHEVVVSVKPEMMTTANELRYYEASRRMCYFSWERGLKFFKNYKQQNCELECFTNYTLQKCNCVAYHMPRESETAICGTIDISCVFDAREELISAFIDGDSDVNCDCLPDCISLTYNGETSISTFNWSAIVKAISRNTSHIPDVMLTQVTIFFKNTQFLPFRRNEIFGMTDFMADCGGLFGLFIGFSFLSLVELVYFMTMRLFCNMRRYGRRHWSGSSDVLNANGVV